MRKTSRASIDRVAFCVPPRGRFCIIRQRIYTYNNIIYYKNASYFCVILPRKKKKRIYYIRSLCSCLIVVVVRICLAMLSYTRRYVRFVCIQYFKFVHIFPKISQSRRATVLAWETDDPTDPNPSARYRRYIQWNNNNNIILETSSGKRWAEWFVYEDGVIIIITKLIYASICQPVYV